MDDVMRDTHQQERYAKQILFRPIGLEGQNRISSSVVTIIGHVSFSGFLLSFEVESRELVLSPTGRAIIRGTTDEAQARALYARYVAVRVLWGNRFCRDPRHTRAFLMRLEPLFPKM